MMVKHEGSSMRESGFTIVELALVVVLIGVSLGIVSLYYGNSQNNLALLSAVTEVEAVIKRAYNIAMQEGVDVYLQFWDKDGEHPDRCAICRVIPGGADEYTLNTPTEPPPPGVTADTDGNKHYWFKIANGAAAVQAPVTLLFSRTGSLVNVSSVQGGMSVTVTVAGKSRTVTVNERGEVST